MIGRSRIVGRFVSAMVCLVPVTSASAVDVLVTASANLSALATADDTVLRWTGNFTVTVDSAYTGKTIAGIDASSFTATIDFQNANRKIILGNSAGNVVVQASGGEVVVSGAGTGARSAGFLVSPSITSEVIEIQTAIDDAANANYWVIGGHTLRMSGTSPQVGDLDLGEDTATATLDVNESATVDLITPTGDFKLDIASGKSLAITQSLSVGANTMRVIGTDSTSTITNGTKFTLNDTSSVLEVSGTVSLADLAITANSKISLLDGATLILPDALAIGARTLTLAGTTGSATETITATNGIQLDNADSLITFDGDVSNALVVSRIDTGADFNAGKGLNVDQSASITAFNVAHNTSIDVATGKTLSGSTILSAAKTITLASNGTVSAITAQTAAGIIKFTGAGTVTTLTNNIAGTTIDVDESASIGTLTLSQNATADVVSGKTLTVDASIGAGKILTASGAGIISRVILNGVSAELNVTGAGTISLLEVDVDGGILDVDSNCTITACTMTSGAGDLTLQNGTRIITSTTGFDVNNNELTITENGGTISLVKLDQDSGILDINESSTITSLTVTADAEVQMASGKTLTSTVSVGSGSTLTHSETGIISTVEFTASSSELKITTGGQLTTLNAKADGGLLNVDETCSVGTVAMTAGSGDVTIDVADGKTLSASIDVNDNRLTLSSTGKPGTITLDTDGGVVNVDASCSPAFAAVTADVTLDIAGSATLSSTVDIGSNTVTLTGGGTINRIDATTGTLINTGTTTITDLRASFGTGGTFTYDGRGESTVTSIGSSTIASGETFRKIGAGTLTLTGGIGTLFGKTSGVRVAIEAGTLINSSSSSSADILISDDAEELTIASGATLTTYGTITVATGGTNVNIDAAEGSVVNLASSTSKSLNAAADNDFQLLGTVNINSAGGTYTLNGPYAFSFGDLNIAGTASLINNIASSSMFFVPGSTVTLGGRGTDGGTLTINGQSTDTRIVIGTTADGDSFLLNRGESDNLTIDNVALSNSTYSSDQKKGAFEDIDLTGTVDVSGNVNWFTRVVADNDDDVDEVVEVDDTTDDVVAEDDQDVADDPTADVETYVGQVARVDAQGLLSAAAQSSKTSANAFVDIENAISGSVVITLADGNLQSTLAGITGGRAVDVTMSATSSVTGPFVAVVQVCITEELQAASGVDESELILYVFDEASKMWTLAGQTGRYRGLVEPTDAVGDYGYDSEFMCAWAVREGLSDFAVGAGSTDSSAITGGDGDSADDADQASGGAPPVCGLFGMISVLMAGLGFSALKLSAGRRRYRAA